MSLVSESMSSIELIEMMKEVMEENKQYIIRMEQKVDLMEKEMGKMKIEIRNLKTEVEDLKKKGNTSEQMNNKNLFEKKHKGEPDYETLSISSISPIDLESEISFDPTLDMGSVRIKQGSDNNKNEDISHIQQWVAEIHQWAQTYKDQGSTVKYKPTLYTTQKEFN